jgi:hypothetical protein
LRTDPDQAWQRYKVSIKLIKINFFSVQWIYFCFR